MTNIKPCIIIPYYGKWPKYLNLFLDSCKRSNGFDVLFFTNLTPPKDYPDNVKFFHLSFNTLQTEIERVIGFTPSIKDPYKLCDFRPIYGLLFASYIKQYDYWGWGDIDVVYGDMKSVLMRLFSDIPDVISLRELWVSGSLCFIKNNSYMVNLFRTTDITPTFKTEKYLGFDEISLAWSEIRIKDYKKIAFSNQNFTQIIKNEAELGKISAVFENHIKESISDNEFLMVNKEKVFSNLYGDIFAYHFISEKKGFFFSFPSWDYIPELFFIDKGGLYQNKSSILRKYIFLLRYFIHLPVAIRRILKRALKKIRGYSSYSLP